MEAQGLCYWYGRHCALQNLSFKLNPGIHALLGPNGSGKTTLMRLMAGQLKPSLGRLKLGGCEPFEDYDRLAAQLGWCPDIDTPQGTRLSVHDFLSALGELSGMNATTIQTRIESLLGELEMMPYRQRSLDSLSRGMRQRVKIAQALLHRPRIALLDEPLAGTDPHSRQCMLRVIRNYAQDGAIVLLSTHLLHDVEALTSNILVIAQGKLVAQGGIETLRHQLKGGMYALHLCCEHPRQLAAQLIHHDSVVAAHLEAKDQLRLDIRHLDMAYEQLYAALRESPQKLYSLTPNEASLSNLFQDLMEHVRDHVRQ